MRFDRDVVRTQSSPRTGRLEPLEGGRLRVDVLVENSLLEGFRDLDAEFGLSLHIEHEGRKILAQVKGTVYTGHCTGEKAYGVLSSVMGETLQEMPTGTTIEV